MHTRLARREERDEIQHGIFARVSATLFMVDLGIQHHSTGLTPPAIAPQHL